MLVDFLGRQSGLNPWCVVGPGLKTGCVVGPGFKTIGVLWVLKIQQVEAHSTGLRVSSLECLLSYIQIFLSLKSRHF